MQGSPDALVGLFCGLRKVVMVQIKRTPATERPRPGKSCERAWRTRIPYLLILQSLVAGAAEQFICPRGLCCGLATSLISD